MEGKNIASKICSFISDTSISNTACSDTRHDRTTMANPNAGHFFQTSDSLAKDQRKAAKAQNKLGRPIKLASKLLAVTADPFDERAVYVAESAGEVRRVVLEVSLGGFFYWSEF